MVQACRQPRKRDDKEIFEKKSKEAGPVLCPVADHLLDICFMLCGSVSVINFTAWRNPGCIFYVNYCQNKKAVLFC